MDDKYSSFAELAANEQEGVDFRIEIEPRDSPVAIIAPHGGKIEPVTTELARLIAGDDFRFYSLIGTKDSGNRDLHITSHHFEEPQCVALVSDCRIVVAIHGRKDRQDPRSVWLGGLDRDLIARAAADLARAGFSAKTDGHEFGALHTENICNRGLRGKGLQIELPWILRHRFQSDTQIRDRFVASVRLSIDAQPASPD